MSDSPNLTLGAPQQPEQPDEQQPAGPSEDTVREAVARHRNVLAQIDEQHRGRPDEAKRLREQAEGRFAEMLARWGTAPPTPQELALQQHDSALMEMDEHSMELIEEQLEREEALEPARRQANAEALRREFGDDYDWMVTDARFALQEGQWHEGIASSRFALKMLANYGKYLRAHLAHRERIERGGR